MSTNIQIVRSQSVRVGFLFSLLSGFSFGAMSFIVHASSNQIPSSELVFLRALLSMFLLTPFVLPQLSLVFSKDSKFLWLRSAAGAISMVCFYWNLQHTTVGKAGVLSNLAPIFIAFLSWKFFNEKISMREGGAIGLALIGVLLLYGREAMSLSIIIALVGTLGALSTSVAHLSLRQAALRFTPELVVWCLSFFTMFASILFSGSDWIVPKNGQLFPMLGVGITGLLGQVFLTRSYMHLRAPIASAFGLSSLVWGVTFEIAFHREIPPAGEWVSYAFVILGVCLLQLAAAERNKPT
jgi:drug/metabolite transporter (DMT)-like permease